MFLFQYMGVDFYTVHKTIIAPIGGPTLADGAMAREWNANPLEILLGPDYMS